MSSIPKELQLNDEQIAVWFSRIKRSYTARAWVYEMWDRLKDYRKGEYWDSLQDQDRVTGMWHMVHIRQLLSQLYFQHARINIFPKARRSIEVAKPLEQLVSYERNVIKAHLAEREALLNNLWYGTGVIKVAWNAEYGEEAPESDTLAKRMSKGMTNAPGTVSAFEDALMPGSPLTEHDPRVVAGHAWVKAVHPLDFLVDSDALCFDEARWFCHRIRRPWLSVVNDKRYDLEARKSINPEGYSRYYSNDASSRGSGRETDWRKQPEATDSAIVTLYEIFDRTTLTMTVISDSCSKVLSRRLFPWFGRKGPYITSQFIPVDDSFWGYPYAETFSPQANAVNKMRSQMMDHIQRHGFPRGAFLKNSGASKESIEAVANAKSGEFVGFDGDRPISEIIDVWPAISLSADVYRAAEIYKQDLREISGVSENQLGGGKGIRTATEASIVQQSSGQRSSDMRFVVDDMVRDVTRAVVRLMKTFWKNEDVIPIVGDGGAFWELSGKILNYEYDVDVEPGSTERVDRASRQRQSIDLLNTVLNAIPVLEQKGVNVQLNELVKLVLENSEIVKNAQLVIPDPGVVPAGGAAPIPPGAEGADVSSSLINQAQKPSSVNQQGNVIQASGAFQSGRQHSEGSR